MEKSKRFLSLGILAITLIFGFQNCSDLSSEESVDTLTSMSVITPSPTPSLSPTPAPTATPAATVIPLSAISDIAAFTDAANRICPTGFLSDNEAPVCFERFAASVKAKVLSDLKTVDTTALCPAGYTERGAVLLRSGTSYPAFQKFCAQYQAATNANMYITHISFFQGTGQLNCRAGDVESARFPYATVGAIFCSSKRGNSQPTSMLANFEVTMTGGTAGSFPAGILKITSISVGSSPGSAPNPIYEFGYKKELSAGVTSFITDVRVLMFGATCPAGYSQVTVLVNKDRVTDGQPLCVKMGTGMDPMVTRVYQNRTVMSGGTYGSVPCYAGDVSAGNLNIYYASFGGDIVAGNSPLCLSY